MIKCTLEHGNLHSHEATAWNCCAAWSVVYRFDDRENIVFDLRWSQIIKDEDGRDGDVGLRNNPINRMCISSTRPVLPHNLNEVGVLKTLSSARFILTKLNLGGRASDSPEFCGKMPPDSRLIRTNLAFSERLSTVKTPPDSRLIPLETPIAVSNLATAHNENMVLLLNPDVNLM